MKFHPIHTLSILVACSRQTPDELASKIEEEVVMEYNLPGIWAKATMIETFTQASCNEDMEQVMENAPKASSRVVDDTVILTYPNAHFRCDQAVQGFAIQTNSGYSVLIQPIEMNPLTVAKCDCGYTLEATLPNVKSNSVRLFHRGDNHGKEGTIREIQVEAK